MGTLFLGLIDQLAQLPQVMHNYVTFLSLTYRGFQVACQAAQAASAKSTFLKQPLIRFNTVH